MHHEVTAVAPLEDKGAGHTALPPAALHPKALAPANLILTVVLSVFGAIVGIQMLASLGITPSTSLIGALAAMTLARVPLAMFRGFRSVHAQNLAQTSISSATFGAANSLFLPIGIPFLFGLPQMVVPMLIGVSLAMLLDAWLLYRMFDTPAFPAKNPWPLGIAAAEAIKAGDGGGKQAWLLLGGLATGVAGAVFKLPMSAFGVALIGGLGAMTAFGIGLLVRGYSAPLFGLDIGTRYVPHGMMIGAGLVALVQVARVVLKKHGRAADTDSTAATKEALAEARGASVLGRSLKLGGAGYLAIMVLLCAGTGIYTGMSPGMLALFIVYGTFAAFVHELIVGIAAMHSGWFPAFAVALISLLLGILIGFPPEALVVLAGFSAATGPAFADMGYDLKAGHLLRGEASGSAFELEGRREQMIAGMVGFGVAIVVVACAYPLFFANHQTAPINAAYVAAIKAGISGETARNLALWAVPGALLQLAGGPRQQLGVLFATGLLIASPMAGWMVAAGIACRLAVHGVLGAAARERLEVFAGGVIAGDALYSFFSGAVKSLRK
ncbi:putative oligopeptide transporter (OPT) family protein [Variovorax boronicumulans]|uniref:Oligopeptide transporter (OPT) family protein n=1 Tax=Variovorax boronicumulans TaxID=436515 RepID=A0AAW8E1T7_9BURK|nr:OPT/YSL family transporter [Variovorax boronicumulans]MDP9880239.1 putative oligopeptide transporter (OPT) family protein [Variovorax boronicumulans]MDP9925524.1 putative oligopeptide transporter (OPT) family protein [Variovorax boronicumulans]